MDEIGEGKLNPECLDPVMLRSEQGTGLESVSTSVCIIMRVDEKTNAECDAIIASHSGAS